MGNTVISLSGQILNGETQVFARTEKYIYNNRVHKKEENWLLSTIT